MSSLPEQFASLTSLKAFVATGNEFEELDSEIVGKWKDLNSLSSFLSSRLPSLLPSSANHLFFPFVPSLQSSPPTPSASSLPPYPPSPSSPNSPPPTPSSTPPPSPTSPLYLTFECSPSLTTQTSPPSPVTSPPGEPACCQPPNRPTPGLTTFTERVEELVGGEEMGWKSLSSVGVG